MPRPVPQGHSDRVPGQSGWWAALAVALSAVAFGALWLTLAGPTDPASWIIGVPAVVAAVWARHRLAPAPGRGLSLLGVLRFLPVFFIESFKGGLDVARRVLGPRLRVEPGLLTYRLSLGSCAARVLFVDLVSLLPGTLSADLEGDTLLVSDYPFGLATYWFETADHPACTHTDGSQSCNYEDIVGHNGFAIIARNDEASRISVYTVGDLARIGIASEYHPSRFIEGLTEHDELLLAACGEDGVVLYGLENLPQLTRVGDLDTPGYARRAKAYDSLIYVADMSRICIYGNPVAGGGSL